MEDMNNLFWLDLEMTGLDPQKDHILEIAVLVTDKDLQVIKEGPSFAIQQPPEYLAHMDDYVRNLHTDSGLLNRVADSTTSIGLAEREIMSFFFTYCISGITILCGNSIWVDRSFLKRYMPHLDACFHYRMIDVSSCKELAKRWYPELPPFEKKKAHRAMEDVYESLEELKHYRATIFK